MQNTPYVHQVGMAGESRNSNAPCSWQPQPRPDPRRLGRACEMSPICLSSNTQLFAYSTEHFRGPIRRSYQTVTYRGSAGQAATYWIAPPPSCTIFCTSPQTCSSRTQAHKDAGAAARCSLLACCLPACLALEQVRLSFQTSLIKGFHVESLFFARLANPVSPF